MKTESKCIAILLFAISGPRVMQGACRAKTLWKRSRRVNGFLTSALPKRFYACLHEYVARNRWEELGKVLETTPLNRGIINQRDEKGRSALFCSINQEEHLITDLLIENGADINLRNTSMYWNALHAAVFWGTSRTVEAILNNRFNPVLINQKDKNGNTALHLASREAKVGIVGLLLEEGADVGAQNDWGATPLHLALEGASKEVILSLLDRAQGVVNQRDNRGHNVLDKAVMIGRKDLVNLVIEYFDQPIKYDKRGPSSCQLAAMTGNIALLHLLIKKGANVQEGLYGEPKDIFEIYCYQKSLIDYIHYVGYTWLHFSAISNPTDMARYLLDLGVSPHIRGEDGRIALDLATTSERVSLLSFD